MAIKLHATANEIELKKNRIKSLNEVTDHDEGYPTALAAKQYADSLKVTVDTELSDKSDNPLQNKVITVELKKLKELGETQSDWNINDTTKPSYVKNRPFYTKKVESDVWEFELPVVNETTYEGVYSNVPIPDADLSQFTNEQELEYDVYAKDVYFDNVVSSDNLTFIKNHDLRKEYKDSIGEGTVIFDTNIPNTIPCLCRYSEHVQQGEDPYSGIVVFGVRIELEGDPTDGKLSFYNDPTHCAILDSMYSFEANSEYTVQVKFKNFKNKVVKDYQIPSKYINWSEQVNDKQWKWEYKVEPRPFDTQPTVLKGDVSKIQANTVYYIVLNTADNSLKLAYGSDGNDNPILVDEVLCFNVPQELMNIFNNSYATYFNKIHCISIDTKNNSAIFGYPSIHAESLDDVLKDIFMPDGLKKLKLTADLPSYNISLSYSPFPVNLPDKSNSFIDGCGVGLAFPYNTDAIKYYSQPMIINKDNTLTVVETTDTQIDNTPILTLPCQPICSYLGTEYAGSITHPAYKGLTHYEVVLEVTNNRQTLVGNGIVTGICWNPIEKFTYTKPYDMSSIKTSYPISFCLQLTGNNKQIFKKDGDDPLGVTAYLMYPLVGSSFSIEGEIE